MEKLKVETVSVVTYETTGIEIRGIIKQIFVLFGVGTQEIRK